MKTPDTTTENIDKIRELFPGCVTESKRQDGQLRLTIDFDLLKQELSSQIVEGSQERFHLDWPGKREALLTANTPISKTLRPCREESIDFDTTQNLFIEGDNLYALKLLQETYLGKVKMIYIDPPYNTGRDFIYKDTFSQGKKDYLRDSGQASQGGTQLVANTESNGRFHSDWLSMMYPRVRLARNLLAEDGVIFISLDSGEQPNLQRICDETFGSNSFVGLFPWRNRTAKSDVPYGVSNDVEWVIAYAKPSFTAGRISNRKYYTTDDFLDRWRLQDLTKNTTASERPNSYFTIVNPKNGDSYPASDNRTWSVTKETFPEYYQQGKIVFPGDYTFLDIRRPKFRVFESEDKAKAERKYGSSDVRKPVSTFLPEDEVGRTEHGSRELRELFGQQIFPYPKPSKLIQFFVRSLCDDNALIMDFFAGSASTAHAVMQTNAEDGGNRNFILVQLPEECDDKSDAHKAGYSTIAEIGKERIRRAGKKILQGDCHEDWNRDIGFRVLKIDSSNMEDVFYTPDALRQDLLKEAADNIKSGRTPEDLLFQVLLDWGVDLSSPIETRTIRKQTVFFVDGNALIACFDDCVTEGLVKDIAACQPIRVVFKDSCFASDTAKINVEQILRQLAPRTEMKVF